MGIHNVMWRVVQERARSTTPPAVTSHQGRAGDGDMVVTLLDGDMEMVTQ